MKTRCPSCLTTFRITSEQMKVRAGKVRCGQCQTVFNALDSLVDAGPDEISPAPPGSETPEPPEAAPKAFPIIADSTSDPIEHSPDDSAADLPPSPPTGWPSSWSTESTTAVRSEPAPRAEEEAFYPQFEPIFVEKNADPPVDHDDIDVDIVAESDLPLDSGERYELGRTAENDLDPDLPRATLGIPAFSKWSEDVVSSGSALPDEPAVRWPFVTAALLLALLLAGQTTFRLRTEIASASPALRPLLLLFSQAFGANLPLSRRVDLVSIEASDLQTDPAHNDLLVLTTTLRNRAGFAQAYPSLELSLTDTADSAIVRRVFPPAEYLPAKISAGQPFVANSEVGVRLWIEAKEVGAAGYRLYVFYP